MNSKIKIELAFAFSQMHENHLAMIPKEILEAVSNDIDTDHLSTFDSNKPFTEQNLSEETLEILATIFKDKFN